MFRKALASLQAQVDDLDRAKVDYYSEVLEGEQEMWELIASKVCHGLFNANTNATELMINRPL